MKSDVVESKPVPYYMVDLHDYEEMRAAMDYFSGAAKVGEDIGEKLVVLPGWMWDKLTEPISEDEAEGHKRAALARLEERNDDRG